MSFYSTNYLIIINFFFLYYFFILSVGIFTQVILTKPLAD
ncbi:hypothetical protein LYSIN_00982 [Lysinibacillus sphaericus]|uniref:Uncharacterized protein n=1 Tax=Lysinibacillus sphaericus TaxID=1421 RepID=A0A2S5CZF3_LYSSH|nr:hypothetical protein LYSIN_00982 [Lysinibacillus sphaericus]